MSFALPAFVVFVLLLPGFVARARIKVVERLSLDYSPFGQLATEAVVWAGALHLVWALLAFLVGRPVRVDVVLDLVASDTALQRQAIAWIADEPRAIAAYFGSLLFVAYVGPLTARWLIVRYRADRLGARWSGLLRFSKAPWYYLLSGADFDTPPDFIVISAIVEVAGQPLVYSGVLENYFLNADGQLDRVILSEVMRRPLDDDRTPEEGGAAAERFYPIDGDYFVLRYSEAVTFNVQYVQLAQGGDADEDAGG